MFPNEICFKIQRNLEEQVQDHHSLLSLSYAFPLIYRNIDPELVEKIFERYPPASSHEHEFLRQLRAELSACFKEMESSARNLHSLIKLN